MKCCDCGNTHPALPGFPNHVLCDYYHLHMSNSADASRCEHFKSKAQTNADRIRTMTDEELAEWILREPTIGYFAVCPPGAKDGGDCPTSPCEQCWLDWLKSPEVDNG